ncbi:MAG: rhomboid family intramembrane serine protease [Cyanobacteriota bacterium]
MGKGRELGLQLREWIEAGTLSLENGSALANRISDLLGDEQLIRGPLRDLASQPLLRQALAGPPSARRTALLSLKAELERTYAPGVLNELLDLLEAASGLPIPRGLSAAPPLSQPAAAAVSPPPDPPPDPQALELQGDLVDQEPPETEGRRHRRQHRLQKRRRRPGAIALGIAPGVALAAATSLVFTWAAGALLRMVLQPWGWSGGVALALLLLGLQLLLLPLRRLRGRAQLHLGDSDQPRRAWAWVTAPWVHARLREALLTTLALLIILGRSPLSFEDVVQRFTLTELTTLALAVGWSRREGLGERSWCGGSGALGALIGLAASLSLLQGRELSFPLGSINIPAWVLLVVVGSLQLSWQLPRQDPEEESTTGQRLLASQWVWGTLLGVGWGVISRLRELIA